MEKGPAILGLVALDRSAERSLQAQLYHGIRDDILAGRLAPGTRLPATRQVASDFGVARNTVVAAFAQLTREGYLVGRVGAGTQVAELPPEALLAVGSAPPRRGTAGRTPRLARRAAAWLAAKRPTPDPLRRAFQPGLPETAGFPHAVWARLVQRHARRPARGTLGYAHFAGLPALRAAISRYLGSARGVDCDPAQVFVVAGTQAGLDLIARLLLDPGDAAWVEEPGYLGARGALLGAGARLVPVPVDAEGIDVAAGRRLAPRARLVYTTPSHQHPLGMTMSLARRLALLEWAAGAGAWIVEDDYDSEYRYRGRPIAAMQGLDGGGRVVYLGSFSKTLLPALRGGFVVVPPALMDPMAQALRNTGHSMPTLMQAALADFITQGHFATHVRRMRGLYAARQAALLGAIARHADGRLVVEPEEAGMQLAARFPSARDDREVAARAAAAGVVAAPLSIYYLGRPRCRGLLLGYAGVPEREIGPAVQVLAGVLGAS
jgi:GntR family transcriptional regulator/MocR family aminotransferase